MLGENGSAWHFELFEISVVFLFISCNSIKSKTINDKTSDIRSKNTCSFAGKRVPGVQKI